MFFHVSISVFPRAHSFILFFVPDIHCEYNLALQNKMGNSMVGWMKTLISSLPSCVTITHLQPLLCDFAEHLPRGMASFPIPWFVTMSSSEKDSQVAQWLKVCLPMTQEV